jgi:zinc transport system substrate-binding protein
MIRRLPTRFRRVALVAALIALVATTTPSVRAGDPIAVVATLPPVHALVAAVMGDTGAPKLLIRAGASPHATTLAPSAAQALEEAHIVFWVGPKMETSLVSAMRTLPTNALMVPLIEAAGLEHRSYRGHGPRSTDDQASHDEDHDHAAGAADQHIWLDPANARAMVRAITVALIAQDPANQSTYARNAAATDALTVELADMLDPVRSIPFIVFHDAYQHMEARFSLNAAGAVTVSPDRRPGAARIVEIRERIRRHDAKCVFVEPQFRPGLAPILVEGTDAQIAALDPLGDGLSPGPELYFELMRRNAHSLLTCLLQRQT